MNSQQNYTDNEMIEMFIRLVGEHDKRQASWFSFRVLRSKPYHYFWKVDSNLLQTLPFSVAYFSNAVSIKLCRQEFPHSSG